MTVKARMPFNAEEFEAMMNAALDQDKAYIDYEDYAGPQMLHPAKNLIDITPIFCLHTNFDCILILAAH